ncbi:uncharacterized protein O3C94_008624 [Discoglossus pictus]
MGDSVSSPFQSEPSDHRPVEDQATGDRGNAGLGRSRGKKTDMGTTRERKDRVVREIISQDSMVMIDDIPVAAAVARPARPTRARKNTNRSERRSRSRSRRSCRCSCACGSERGRSPRRARRSESPGRQERRRDTPLAVSTPRLPEAGGQKQLWIVGHSYVYWAHRLAAVIEGRTQLGFPVTDLHVRWFGVRGLRWAQLDELLNTCSQRYGQPTIIIIHAGGNDLGAVPMRRMLKVMKRDVESWTKKFPGTFLIWSEMIKRRSWRNARDPVGLDKARQKINQQLSSFIRKLGFIAIRYKEFEPAGADDFFSPDKVHLTEMGLELVTLEFRESAVRALALMNSKGGWQAQEESLACSVAGGTFLYATSIPESTLSTEQMSNSEPTMSVKCVEYREVLSSNPTLSVRRLEYRASVEF